MSFVVNFWLVRLVFECGLVVCCKNILIWFREFIFNGVSFVLLDRDNGGKFFIIDNVVCIMLL